MAILKQRLAKRQDDGSFVPVHLETSSDLVLRPDGTFVEAVLIAMTDDIAGKADASHAHAELTEVINAHVAKKDNPHGVTIGQIGAAAASHTHTKEQITNFPTSLPASDVPAWAKAASKPTYTASEVGAAAASHTHPAQTSVTGNAGSASRLATPRAFTVNLASSSGVNFDGTANCSPGVSGILPVSHGGTGTNNLATLLANAGGLRLGVGVYTGDGAASRHIELGYKPKAVYLTMFDGTTRNNSYSPSWICGGLALEDNPCATVEQVSVGGNNYKHNWESGVHNAILIDNSGFTVYEMTTPGGSSYGYIMPIHTNLVDIRYYYIALY